MTHATTLTAPLIGTVQCGDPDAYCGNPDAQCNGFLVNDPGYIVNLDLTPRPPPRVPENPARWPFFLYIGGETFPDHAEVDETRRAEFERLLLKLRPAQQWVVTLVDYVEVDPDELITQDGETLTTEGGDPLAA